MLSSWNHIYEFIYVKGVKSYLLKHIDVSYLSVRFQTWYVFACGNMIISERWVKQTMVVTFPNQSEILVIHETSQECVWLRSIIQYIRESCRLSSIKDNQTMLHKDNIAWITHIIEGWIKDDKTNYILPKFFYTHELQKSSEINV